MLTVNEFSTPAMQECVNRCLECHTVLLQTVAHCLAKGGVHADLEHVRTLSATAELCQVAANMMLMASPFHFKTCEVAGEAALFCAEQNETLLAQTGESDATLEACTTACRKCAESCQKMALTAVNDSQ